MGRGGLHGIPLWLGAPPSFHLPPISLQAAEAVATLEQVRRLLRLWGVGAIVRVLGAL